MPTTRHSQRIQKLSTERGIQKTKDDAKKRALRKRTASIQHAVSINLNPNPKAASRRGKKETPLYLRRVSIDVSTDLNTSLSLFKLPKELLDHIATYLPPESLVCLTLTCKQALNILTPESWSDPRILSRWYISLGSGLQHRALLLQLLTRDVEGMEFCARCSILHPTIKPPSSHQVTPSTWFCLSQEAAIDYWPQTPEGGYSVVFPHVERAFLSRAGDGESREVGLFRGDFTFQVEGIRYRMCSSARWVERNLVLKHEHRLRSSGRMAIKAVDVTSLPLRICAHQTTSTVSIPPSRYTKSTANGPLLTHAIVTAFPANKRTGLARASKFRPPSRLEQEQMAAADAGEDVVWKCRSCPTKFQVQYVSANGGELVVTAWHCFGKELYMALNSWKKFVRREGPLLGGGKRNSEFYSHAKSVSDFAVE